MFNTEKSKNLILSIIILIIPFLEFIKNNLNEFDIIVGKSFYVLIILITISLLFIAYILNFFIKKLTYFESLLISTTAYWVFFKHNSLNLFFQKIFQSNKIGTEFSSEISLLFLVLLTTIISIFVIKKSVFFKRFISLFFLLSFFFLLLQISFFKKDVINSDQNKENLIVFPDKANNKKDNIYFFILDAMQPLKDFEKYYNIELNSFISEYKKHNYIYFNNTENLYTNTTDGLSAVFYLDKIFTKDKKLKKKAKVLFPTLLRKNFKSDLIYNLENLGYEFKWIGNFFAYCPKFNLRYCLNQNQHELIDTYLYINFFRQSPLIQIIWSTGRIFNFDFNKYFFYNLNDGMGRLTKNLGKNKNLEKPTFYFVHHMSPHWPYITDKDCSFKNYPGEENFEGYKSAYLCNLKKIKNTIEFIEKNDPNSFVVFQSDHNWQMSKTKKEKKLIFNLIKEKKNCRLDKDVNLNNVNSLRLIFSCITGNKVEFINF
tara:strand:+ start:8264 stop:9721 length:1458 start_codon:yes stop_codon:yes gene_type:complete